MGVSQPINEKLNKRASLGSYIKKVTSECFATQSANVTVGAGRLAPVCVWGEKEWIILNFIMYQLTMWITWFLMLRICFIIKKQNSKMKDGLDFIKIKNYAVINLNNMFPVPKGNYIYVDISKISNPKYKMLLLAEYRYIKSIQEKIRKNAENVYKIKTRGDSTPLTKRCNDFLLLEDLCQKYMEL